MATLTQEQFDLRLSQCKTLEDIALLRDEVSKYIPPAEAYDDFERAFRYYGWLGLIAARGVDVQRALAEVTPEQPVEPEEPSSPIIPVTGDVETGEWVADADR